MDRGFTLWFTGLSGAGKSTLARLLETELRELGRRVEVLDGDIVRTHLSKGLGFSREDRDTNILRIGFVCDLLSRNGVIAIAAAISPYRETRDKVRAQIQDFIEIFVECSLEECARRDVKGLYKEALDGKIAGFTGVSDPYEEPDAPEIIVMTAEQTPAESVALILDWLRNHDYLPRPAATAISNGHDPVATVATVASSNGHAPDHAYSEEEEAEVSKRLTDLGYL